MDGSHNKLDRRVVRTKKMIKEALVELLSEQNSNNVSITDITQRADINRKTFYNHYAAVHEIIEEIEDEIVTKFTGLIENTDIIAELQNPYNFLNNLSAIMFNAINRYGAVLKQEQSLTLILKFTEKIKANVSKSLKKQTKLQSSTLNIFMDFVFTGMLAVYRNWLLSGQKQPLKEVSDILSILSISAFNGLNKK